MRVKLESTDKIVTLATGPTSVPARVWEGTTEGGVRVVAFITRITPMDAADASEFERDLKEVRAPSPDVQAFRTRLVL